MHVARWSVWTMQSRPMHVFTQGSQFSAAGECGWAPRRWRLSHIVLALLLFSIVGGSLHHRAQPNAQPRLARLLLTGAMASTEIGQASAAEAPVRFSQVADYAGFDNGAHFDQPDPLHAGSVVAASEGGAGKQSLTCRWAYLQRTSFSPALSTCPMCEIEARMRAERCRTDCAARTMQPTTT